MYDSKIARALALPRAKQELPRQSSTTKLFMAKGYRIIEKKSIYPTKRTSNQEYTPIHAGISLLFPDIT
jgi:hypothetical protein